MKGWETSSSRRVDGISGGRRPCLHQRGVEPRKWQPEIVPAAGKSEGRRPGSEQTSNLASGVSRRGEIFGHPVPVGGGGGVPGGSRCMGVRQWINSVLGTEKSTFLE